jgi:fused signal recognition particle receptor
MFGLLKDKLKGFVDKLTQREQEKPAEAHFSPDAKRGAFSQGENSEKKTEAQAVPIPEAKQPEKIPEKITEKIHEPERKPEPKIIPRPEPKPKPIEIPKPVHVHVEKPKHAEPPKPIHIPKPEVHKPKEIMLPPKPVELPKPIEVVKPIPTPAPAPVHTPLPEPKPEPKKGGFLGVNLSIESKVRSLFSSTVTIKEKDVDDLLDQLELDMLESDVAYDVALALKDEIKKGLVGRSVDKGKLNHAIADSIRSALLSVMESEKPDVVALAKAKAEKPYVILFLGPNGAGKTTTIAKFAGLMKSRGLNCVIALADTFRAASQEQGLEWAKRLDVKAIGGAYGSDAAAIAYNAREHAKAKGIEVVLIDSAGRQETSKNLMEELAKIGRVVKPDMKIYVGEAIAGNSLVEQVKEFDKYVGIDGVILTKADVDAKGGSAISIYKATGKPILYIGVGQGEKDLREFDAKWVVGNVMGDGNAS